MATANSGGLLGIWRGWTKTASAAPGKVLGILDTGTMVVKAVAIGGVIVVGGFILMLGYSFMSGTQNIRDIPVPKVVPI